MDTSAAQGWAQQGCEAAGSARKRVLDVTVAALAIVALLPALVLVAIAIYLESGGPVLFRQRRAGLAGRPFTILKFRTMVDGGPGEVWTARGDFRVTRVGAFLRRTSLDELPQLLNVIAGDMSLVGPRPHPIGLDAQYQPVVPGYQGRYRAKPGITGLAQVSDLRGSIGDVAQMRQRIAADAEYIDNWSFRRDLVILAKTIPHLLTSGNAY